MTSAGSPADRVAVGRVTRAHGVRGEVSVLVLTEVEGRFAPGSTLTMEDGRRFRVETARPNRDRVLVKFEQVPDRDGAEALVGSYLFVGADEVPAAPEGAWWPHQLIGCRVVTEGGAVLGSIREIVPGAPNANDLWVAGPPEKEVLIPALNDVVSHVDVEARRVVVRDLPGITTPG